MLSIEVLFWCSLVIVFYTYAGYSILLYILSRFKKVERLVELSEDQLPHVTHIIAAYNEESVIHEKIENALSLDYPESKIKHIVVADGSNDGTVEILKRYSSKIQLFYQPERQGKLAAIERVLSEVDKEIVIFSDANAMLSRNAIGDIVRHFFNPKVGAVAGEKVVQTDLQDNASATGENIYWQYESLVKKWEYRLNSVIGAAGELFAIRKSLYNSPGPNSIIEDFVITMQIAMKGYRVAYEPDAKAYERSSTNIPQEAKRKVRIAAGGVQAMVRLYSLFNIFRHGILSWQYVSHRVLRWTLGPISLVLLLISNAILAFSGLDFFRPFLLVQIIFYGMSFLGFIMETRKTKMKLLYVPFYFTFMNFCVLLGMIRYAQGKVSVIWEKVERR
jgi:cellulose synthase/poly-beta-1,6-N-acetylglucosamine synthase-like glycosyltransferase